MYAPILQQTSANISQCFEKCFVFVILVPLCGLTVPVFEAFDDAQDFAALLFEEGEHEDDCGAGDDSCYVPQPRPTEIH